MCEMHSIPAEGCLPYSDLFRYIKTVAVVVAVFFIMGHFVFFPFDHGLSLVAPAMSIEERIKAALHGPIVISDPAIRRQAEACLGVKAMLLRDSDLCQRDINLRVLANPVGLKLLV